MHIRENNFFDERGLCRGIRLFCFKPLREDMLHSEIPGIHLGSSGAVYNQKRADMEALIRPLWGLAPYWRLKTDDALKMAYLKKTLKWNQS
ncbi:DUF2264 domain-containing protein [uncultured Enterococcus sp.]|uniref:DUF2264 domain-containing protein n=1 Tax=uncultured Enterococcus sp. TaxID=167972 RepID=UPI002AA7D6A6|nr:DUF2264 domain-containing protein [uncultured Enterococcus sp.]